jgi:hypothetical protein
MKDLKLTTKIRLSTLLIKTAHFKLFDNYIVKLITILSKQNENQNLWSSY